MRVFTAEFCHETNTFSTVPTTLESFGRSNYLDQADAIIEARSGTRTSLGATIDAADRYGWDLIHSVSATANPGGKVTNAAFEHICKILVAYVSEGEGKIDGCLIHLHGSMVTEGLLDGDGEILKRLRSVVGGEVPIVVTLDLHANVTKAMCKYANCLVACRTYPHVDFYETALTAADILQQSMEGLIKPVTVLAKGPLLKGLDGGKTHKDSPMSILIGKAKLLEESKDNAILSVCACAGFSSADIPEVGPSIVITFDRWHGLDVALHRAYLKNIRRTTRENKGISYKGLEENKIFEDVVAAFRKREEQTYIDHAAQAKLVSEEYMNFIWDSREYASAELSTVPQAVERASVHCALLEKSFGYGNTIISSVSKPLVIADVTDNPGSGHYGDTTSLLQSMVECTTNVSYNGRQNKGSKHTALSDVVFYAIHDPAAVQAGVAIGIGKVGSIVLGGKGNPELGGGPIILNGRVVALTDGHFPAYGAMGGGVWMNQGVSMVFRVGTRFDIVIISNNMQLLDIAQITSMGIDPSHKKIIVVKSKQHFRASLGEMAHDIVLVDGGGLGSEVLNGERYKNVRRPIWPLDHF